jgi:hypothetical protein
MSDNSEPVQDAARSVRHEQRLFTSDGQVRNCFVDAATGAPVQYGPLHWPQPEGGAAMPVPLLPPSADGIYPSCVWCRGEQYGPDVRAYSRGEVPCSAVGGCGQYVPDSHLLGDQT